MSFAKWEGIFARYVREAVEKSDKPSNAHMLDHSKRVWERCMALSKSLGGDSEVLLAAAYLHDLARHQGHVIHGVKSAKLAKPILAAENFPENKIPAVLEAISVHDWQTKDRDRKTLESRILYDADKMDAFGASGVKRHILYYYHIGAEEASPIQILEVLKTKWKSLSFERSRELARDDYDYITDFFRRLAKEEG